MSTSSTDRWAALDFAPPAPDVEETEPPVLLDLLSDGRVARITLNRPHADNAITTEMGALLTEVVEDIAVQTAVRVVILTGAGDRAFSVGSDLRQRKAMTKEDWLRQRQAFDRTLYTVRQLRKPIFTAVNGLAYGGGCELAQSTDFIIASDQRHLRPARVHARPGGRRGVTCAAAPPAAPRQGAADAHDRRPDPAQEAYRLGMVNELHDPGELMGAAQRIADKIAGNSPTAVQAVKRAVHLGEGQPIEEAIAIMMDAHWRSAVHPDRVEASVRSTTAERQWASIMIAIASSIGCPPPGGPHAYGLDGGRRVARDLVRDPLCGALRSPGSWSSLTMPSRSPPGRERIAGHEHLQRLAARQEAGRSAGEPPPAARPSIASGWPNVALVEAMMKSVLWASSQPPP